MARTSYYIKNGTYARQDLSNLIDVKRKTLGFKLKDLSDEIGISDRYMSQKIKEGDFTHKQLFLLFNKLEFTEPEILLVFGHNKKEKDPGIMEKLSEIEREVKSIRDQMECKTE